MLHQVPHVTVAGPLGLGGVDDQGDDVDLAERGHRDVDHAHVEAMQGAMHARGVDVDNLPVGTGVGADDPVARRLRLVGDDRQLGADEPVEQGRLTGVGPADQGDESGPHGPGLSASTVARFCTRTRVTRRRSASSTSTARPSTSTRSPLVGTRPRVASR